MEFDYEKMLKKAMEKLPQKIETRERFEIPEVICEIQGNKTLVRNFGEIVLLLRRDKSHLMKFLLKELAVPGNIRGMILILQGKVSKEILQRKVESYVKEFVFCKKCKKPDTKIIKEKREFFLVCEACGAKFPIRSL
jgi:translation initiation factor 2 subunit 2